MTTSAKGKDMEKKDAAKGPKPSSALNDLTDHSVGAVTDDITDGSAPDMSIHARLSRTGYVLNENEITGERWVGLSIQRDPDADAASKAKTRITNIAEIPPRKGLTVKPINGEPFAVSDEFDKDSTPADWFAVLGSDGKPFLK